MLKYSVDWGGYVETQGELKEKKIRSLFSYKKYIVFLIGNLISRFGDSIDSIAFAWMVYELTGSKTLMGILFAINVAPNIIFSPFSGVLVDYFPKKLIIVIGHVGRGAMVSLTAIMYYFGILEPWHLYIITFINSTFETFAVPASGAIMPLLLDEDMYLVSNSVSTSANSLVQLLGLGAAGIIIRLSGISGAILFDGITFLLAAFIVMGIKIPMDKKQEEELTPSLYIESLKEGLRYVINNNLIRIIMLLGAIINFCFTPLVVLQAAYVKEVLKYDSIGLTILNVVFTIGIILGGILMSKWGSNYKDWQIISFGCLFMGISMSIFALSGYVDDSIIKRIYLAASMMFSLGIFNAFVNTAIGVYMLKNNKKEILGRINALMHMVVLCAMPIGSLLTGILSEILPIQLIFLIMGILVTLISLSLFVNRDFKSN